MLHQNVGLAKLAANIHAPSNTPVFTDKNSQLYQQTVSVTAQAEMLEYILQQTARVPNNNLLSHAFTILIVTRLKVTFDNRGEGRKTGKHYILCQ